MHRSVAGGAHLEPDGSVDRPDREGDWSVAQCGDGVEHLVHEQPEVDQVVHVEGLQRRARNGDCSSNASVADIGRQHQDDRTVTDGFHE